MKKLALLFTILIFSCDSDRRCFTIIDKTITNVEYILIGDFDTTFNSNDESGTSGFADVNLEVSQSVYNAYDIGDDYCYD